MENLSQKYVNKQGINEGKIVLHSDLNNFFASVECKKRPELKGLPVAVCGSREDRHGIVLAKNELAKKCGVKTAEAIWQAKPKAQISVRISPMRRVNPLSLQLRTAMPKKQANTAI